jgi:hypothetical protein
MGESTATINVANCPNAWNVSPQEIIDGDVTALISFNSGFIKAEIISVWFAADGEQNMATDDLFSAFLTVGIENNLTVLLLDTNTAGVGTDFYAFVFENFTDSIRNIFVFATDKSGPHLNDRDAAAKTPIHLSEFQSDIAAADDD